MASGVSRFFSFLWRVLDGLRRALHLILLLFLFALLIAAFQTSIPVVPESAALVLNPQGDIVEQLSGDPLDRALGRAASDYDPETQLRDILDALKAAATDKRIKLVVLDLQHIGSTGLSKLQEIGAAIDAFRGSGKRVIAVSDLYGQAAYYLAAHADEINVDPLGAVVVDGFARYQMYFKDALDKLGVDFNVFKVGTYKSYTETFTRNDMSDAEKEQSMTWLNAAWSVYQRDVTRARRLHPDALSDYVARAVPRMQEVKGNAAKMALDQKLVTAIKTREQVNEELKKVVGEDDKTHLFKAIELDDYVTALHAENPLERRKGDIGIIVASGEILDGTQPPGTVGGESLARIIREARDNKDLKAVVLRIDSPGGSMLAAEQIYRELLAFKKSGKPLIASMSSVAASGGYYIALGADEIWASPTTITGSIGVFATIPTFQDTLRKLGVHVDGLGTTELSGQRLDRALSPQTKALLQTSVEYAYSEFLTRVAAGRKRTVAAIDSVAQGRVWAGTDAKSHGLVDSLGLLRSAVEIAAKRANLDKDYTVRYLDPELTWQEALAMDLRGTFGRLAGMLGLGRLIESARPPALVREVVDPLERELKRWARLNDPRGLYSYCFCTFP